MYHIDEVRWDITKRCNLRCKHCYVGPSLTNIDTPDAIDTQEALLQVQRFADDGVKRIQFLGGEPFARPDFMTILDAVAKCNISILISTNGTYIDAAVAKRLATYPRWAITFSLDGPTARSNDVIRGSGVFRRATTGIRELVTAKTSSHPVQTVAINTVLTKHSVQLIPEMFELAGECGVDVLQFNSIDRQGFADIQDTAVNAGLSPAQLLDSSLQITRMSQEAGFEVRQVYLQPIARKYIAQQLGTQFEPIYGGCKAGVRGAFLNESGELFSCSELTYGRYPEESNGMAEPLNGRTSLRQAVFTVQFEAMQKLRDTKIHRTRYEPCNRCEFNTLCHPCALPSIKSADASVTMSLCREAHARLDAVRLGDTIPVEESVVPLQTSITAGLCK